MSTLLQDIEAFLETHGMSQWQFGQEALGDRHFVKQIRGGMGEKPRRVWPETEAKVRLWMAKYRPESEAA